VLIPCSGLDNEPCKGNGGWDTEQGQGEDSAGREGKRGNVGGGREGKGRMDGRTEGKRRTEDDEEERKEGRRGKKEKGGKRKIFSSHPPTHPHHTSHIHLSLASSPSWTMREKETKLERGGRGSSCMCVCLCGACCVCPASVRPSFRPSVLTAWLVGCLHCLHLHSSPCRAVCGILPTMRPCLPLILSHNPLVVHPQTTGRPNLFFSRLLLGQEQACALLRMPPRKESVAVSCHHTMMPCLLRSLLLFIYYL